jgi:type II secretory pathway pseudopilin PulG
MVTMRRFIARSPARAVRGFTYLWVLLAIALVGIGLVAVSEVWTVTVRRQKVEELEWTGAQFVQAIGSYYYSSPGAARQYPPRLDDLLEDRRFIVARRHLRQVYVNPFSGKADWELTRGGNGGIVGVRATWPVDAGTASKEFVFRPLGIVITPGD